MTRSDSNQPIKPWKPPGPPPTERRRDIEPLYMSGEEVLFALRLMMAMELVATDSEEIPDHPQFDVSRIKAIVEKQIGSKTTTKELGNELMTEEGDISDFWRELYTALRSLGASPEFRGRDKVNFWDIMPSWNFLDIGGKSNNPHYYLLKAIADHKITIFDVRKE